MVRRASTIAYDWRRAKYRIFWTYAERVRDTRRSEGDKGSVGNLRTRPFREEGQVPCNGFVGAYFPKVCSELSTLVKARTRKGVKWARLVLLRASTLRELVREGVIIEQNVALVVLMEWELSDRLTQKLHAFVDLLNFLK